MPVPPIQENPPDDPFIGFKAARDVFWPTCLSGQARERQGKGKGFWPLRVSQSTRPCTPPHSLFPVFQYHPNALGFESKCAPGLMLSARTIFSGARPCSACHPFCQALPGADDFLFCGLVTRLSCSGVICVHQAGPTVRRHFHFDLEKASDAKGKQ